jgi:hypothetical protein
MVLAKEEALAKGSILPNSFACASWQKITFIENGSQLTPHESHLASGCCARVHVLKLRELMYSR